MAVYYDQHKATTEKYLGQGEFYLEYGDVDYEITLPSGFLLAGSGVLTNADSVLGASQRARLAHAAVSDSVVQIVTPDEATVGATRHVPGTRTWRMRAERVRDVAWAAAP